MSQESQTKARLASQSTTGAHRAAAAKEMLREDHAADREQRLDLTSQYLELSIQVRGLANLARLADLVKDDLLRQKGCSGGHQDIQLDLQNEQVETWSWVCSELVDYGNRADKLIEEIEEIACKQRIMVRVPAEEV